MTRLTAQQKRDRELLTELMVEQIKSVRIEMGIEHAKEIERVVTKAELSGWHKGRLAAVNHFSLLTWWERLMWKAER